VTATSLLIVGAGPGLGFSVAKRFGREGFAVALISRSAKNLEALVADLANHGVEAAGFTADATDERSLRDAIASARARFGTLDVLEYSPAPDHDTVVDALSITPENARHHVGRSLFGAITAARAVLPEMLERGHGALLFTTGASAAVPIPSHASVGLGMSALRNYARVLHAALKGTGVFAGSLMVATRILKDTEGDPDALADIYWHMYTDRDEVETIIGHLEGLTVR
jgi:NAD(P)-dependent dehydrogenase (short-subunit alcohol dehydrogenase family)